MDARRLLLFRTVARAGSISAAARELGWTQPAVSQHLQRLEREVGAPVLLRSTRGVALTEAGRVLLARADVIAGELHMAGEEIAALTELREGRVRLVAFPTAAATIAPAALRRLADDHPGVAVTLAEAEPPEAVTDVRAGDADLAVVFGHDAPPPGIDDLVWRELGREDVRLVLPPGHEAAYAGGPVDLRALAGETWIGGCPRCRQHLVDVCERAGFTPRLAHESDDYVAVQSLVAAGLGVSSLPEAALTAYRHPEVVVRSSPGLGRRHVGVVHRPGADLVPATRALLDRLAMGPAVPDAPPRPGAQTGTSNEMV